jgi:hypothetical protein
MPLPAGDFRSVMLRAGDLNLDKAAARTQHHSVINDGRRVHQQHDST